MISLRTHNILDYVIGAVLLLCPYLFGFSFIDPAKNVFLVLGFGLIAYSLITDYRFSIAKIIPVGAHMMLDVTLGVVMIASPWLFGYRLALTGFQFFLHWILGLGAIALVMLTRTRGQLGLATRTEDREIDRAA